MEAAAPARSLRTNRAPQLFPLIQGLWTAELRANPPKAATTDIKVLPLPPLTPGQTQNQDVDDNSAMSDENHTKMEGTSSSLSSPTISLSEKTLEAEQSTREATRSPTPAPSVKAEEAPELKKVMSAKEAQAELTKIMTSGEGVEYPTGVKLNLISLALCLSVFLMALDNTIVSHNPTAYFACTNNFAALLKPTICTLHLVWRKPTFRM